MSLPVVWDRMMTAACGYADVCGACGGPFDRHRHVDVDDYNWYAVCHSCYETAMKRQQKTSSFTWYSSGEPMALVEAMRRYTWSMIPNMLCAWSRVCMTCGGSMGATHWHYASYRDTVSVCCNCHDTSMADVERYVALVGAPR